MALQLTLNTHACVCILIALKISKRKTKNKENQVAHCFSRWIVTVWSAHTACASPLRPVFVKAPWHFCAAHDIPAALCLYVNSRNYVAVILFSALLNAAEVRLLVSATINSFRVTLLYQILTENGQSIFEDLQSPTCLCRNKTHSCLRRATDCRLPESTKTKAHGIARKVPRLDLYRFYQKHVDECRSSTAWKGRKGSQQRLLQRPTREAYVNFLHFSWRVRSGSKLCVSWQRSFAVFAHLVHLTHCSSLSIVLLAARRPM